MKLWPDGDPRLKVKGEIWNIFIVINHKMIETIVHPKMKIHSVSTHPCADVRMGEDPQFTKQSRSLIQYNQSEW